MDENEILLEIEQKIDIHKEEAALESFMKESMDAGQVYGIYKLKTKAMHEKLERIKNAFEDQSDQVKELRTIFDDDLNDIKE